MNPGTLSPSPRTTRLVVVALLALMAALMFTSARQESQTFDESDHLYAGFEYWKHADFGRNPEHPPLMKLMAALPLLPMGLKEPAPIPFPFFKMQDFINASQFLYITNGNGKADAILMRGRAMVAIFSLVLGLLIFLATQEMFETRAALLALGLFVFEPVMLSNGPLITTDMPLTCLFFASVYTFYRYLKQPSVARLALCSILVGLTMTAKHSGALIAPTLVLLAIAHYLTATEPQDSQAEVDSTKAETRIATRCVKVGKLVGALAVIGLVSYVWMWAIYGFHYAARPGQLVMQPTLDAYSVHMHPMSHAVIGFFARHHLFPEAYLYGWVDILSLTGWISSFIFGHLYPSGRWYFFPGVFVIKSTLTLLILLALVPFAKIRGRRRELLFLTIPVAFYLGISIASMLNMGIRHILPSYPFCFVLAGVAASALWARSAKARIAVAALLLLTVVSSLHCFPDFLAYSNEAAGGPANTWRLITDSNDDWGQGLKWTKTYLDRKNIHDCWFDYSNPNFNPAYYGIPCKPLLSGMGHLEGLGAPTIPPTISGTVLISAMEMSGIVWGPGVLNPYQIFLDRKPDAEIGNVILVYHGTFDVSLLAAYAKDNAALAMMWQHRMPEAMALAQEAVQEAPDSTQANLFLGEILLQSGHTAEGQQYLATARHLAQTIEPDFQRKLLVFLTQPHSK